MKNLPLIIAAAAGIYLLNKKPAKKSSPQTGVESQPQPIDPIPLPIDPVDPEPIDEMVDELPDDKDVEKEYLSLFPERKVMIDKLLKVFPTQFNLGVNIIPLNDTVDYNKWSKNGSFGLYQDWLTTMCYVRIALIEAEWDAHSGKLPLILECGKKLEVVSLDPPIYGVIALQETDVQCFNRLHLGRTLWIDINNYIHDNIDVGKCLPGIKCQ